MADQLPLPELPPMKPAAQSSAPISPAANAPQTSSPKAGFGGTKRLRQALTAIAGGGFALVLLICLAQLILRPGLRPADLMATIEAQTELGIMNQKLGHDPGEHVLTEAQYQEAIAKAQRDGQAKAELDYQKKLAVVQADKERVVGAYQTLYQRANLIAQAGVQMESVALQFRQRILESSNGGRNVIIAIYDGLCAIGDEDSCQKARDARRGMIQEYGELSEGDMAAKVNKLMAGIEDPATFITRDDQRRNGVPALPR